MASVSAPTNSKAKSANGSDAPAKSASARPATSKSAPAKRRAAARPKSATPRKASTASARKVPQWLTIGASVTGAVVAVGATLFATRDEWLPRAKKLGAWVEKSVHDQLDTIGAAKSKLVAANDPEAPVVSLASTGIQ